MKDNLMRFNILTDNEYWSLLSSAHSLHVTARDKHQQLLDLCQKRGVKFVDIKRHLLNEAKKVGLYRKTQWNGLSGDKSAMTYPSEAKLAELAWFVAMSNFIKWVKNNYKAYDVPADKVARSNPPVKSIIIRRGELERRSDSFVGKPPSAVVNATELPTAQPAVQPVSTAQPAQPVAPANEQPVVQFDNLSVAQIQAIIIRNFSVLGGICQEKGAVEEFNLLMDKLGLYDEIIDTE